MQKLAVGLMRALESFIHPSQHSGKIDTMATYLFLLFFVVVPLCEETGTFRRQNNSPKFTNFLSHRGKQLIMDPSYYLGEVAIKIE